MEKIAKAILAIVVNISLIMIMVKIVCRYVGTPYTPQLGFGIYLGTCILKAILRGIVNAV